MTEKTSLCTLLQNCFKICICSFSTEFMLLLFSIWLADSVSTVRISFISLFRRHAKFHTNNSSRTELQHHTATLHSSLASSEYPFVSA